MDTKITLTYEERMALPVIRNLLKRKPEAANLIMDGLAKEAALSILLSAKKELEGQHTIARALVAAASIITELDKPKEQS